MSLPSGLTVWEKNRAGAGLKKYFPDENPIGKIISAKIYGATYDLKITGIFKDIPANSTLQANFISSITYSTLCDRCLFPKIDFEQNMQLYGQPLLVIIVINGCLFPKGG